MSTNQASGESTRLCLIAMLGFVLVASMLLVKRPE
jgi:hypothetical protein